MSQLSVATGAAMVEGILSLILTVFVGLVFIGIQPPASASAGFLFFIAVVLAFSPRR